MNMATYGWRRYLPLAACAGHKPSEQTSLTLGSKRCKPGLLDYGQELSTAIGDSFSRTRLCRAQTIPGVEPFLPRPEWADQSLRSHWALFMVPEAEVRHVNICPEED
jgi:hypothetical protein